MLSLPRRAPARVPFDRRTDDPRALVLKESGRYAALDTLNRALVKSNTIRLCRPRFECDSPLKCVTCSVYRLAERRADLQAALRGAPAAVMVTLTTAHGHLPLVTEWTEIEKILRRFTERGDWSRFKKMHGIDGYAVTTEQTHNRNGWNVHLHLILTLGHQPTPGAAQALQDAIRRRWCRAAAHTGHEALEDLQTFSWMRPDFDADDMAEYVTKQNLRRLSTDPARSRYPGDLLAGALDGDVGDMQQYRQYLDAATNRSISRAYGRLSRHLD